MITDPLPPTLLVLDLIAELMSQHKAHGNVPVYLCYDYGDHCHTQAIDPLNEVELYPLQPTGYSRSGWAVDEQEKDLTPEAQAEADQAQAAKPRGLILRA